MKTTGCIVFAALSFACLFFLNSAKAAVGIGSTQEEVIAQFGKPTGELSDGEELVYSYPGGIVSFKDGRVCYIDDSFTMHLEQRKRDEGSGSASISRENESPPLQKIMTLNEGGKQIDLSTVLVRGKVTVVDFFASWCGPCRALAPALERLAADNDVYLRKIDIVNWGTPITVQYDIKNVPDIRVFDRRGCLVGRPTCNFSQVQEFVKQAKHK